MNAEQIGDRLAIFLGDAPVPASLFGQLEVYLALLQRWNARTNLTAVRTEAEIVDRHFGESLFLGVHLRECLAADGSMLDFGSGAGFPGLPVQLLLPAMRVTLAESQGKKAAFLREAVGLLGLETEVFARRVETMAPARRFDCVALRAVDRMEMAIAAARERVAPGGWLAMLTSAGESVWSTGGRAQEARRTRLPGSERRELVMERC